jgi:uncharacterized protein with FMN-binding domain
MKKGRVALVTIGIVLAVLVGALLIAKAVLESGLKDVAAMKIENVDLGAVADGEYLGSYEVFPILARTRTIIEGHAIKDIRILEHRTGQGQGAERIVKDMVAEQRIDVNTVSGATYSSKVIQKAVADSLISK